MGRARVKLVDTLELGRYRARLLDAATGELLWSRGFDSYFGEWKTTGPAGEGVRRTYHESVRCPLPLREAVLALDHRGADNTLREVFRTSIDPQSPELRREPLADDLVTVEAHVGGGTAECVDVVILGEGYTKDDTAKFEADVRRFADALLGREPFASLKRRVSVRGVLKPSQDRGCDEPTLGVHRQTALGCTFNSLGSERYLLTEDNRAIREVARAVPYDVLSIMVNHTRYGGGGIYNLFNTFTSGAVTSSCTSSATASPAWPTSTILRARPTPTSILPASSPSSATSRAFLTASRSGPGWSAPVFRCRHPGPRPSMTRWTRTTRSGAANSTP